MRRKPLGLLVTALAGAMGGTSCGSDNEPPSEAKVTWVAVADWYLDVGNLRIFMDGALTRFNQDNFFGGGSGLSFSRNPVCPDEELDKKLLAAIGDAPDVMMTGHSNLDHSYDTGIIARLSGAKIIGAPTTCFQAMAEGVDATRCTDVYGGEKIELSNGVTVHVVRWNHSGNTSNLDLHEPRELTAPPVPDANGCFRPGVLEDFPNGGGGRGYLVIAGPSGKRFSLFFTDTGSSFDFDQPIVLDGKNYGSPEEGLKKAMADAGLDSVDLWIAGSVSDQLLVEKVVPILNAKAVVPNHLGSFFEPFAAGLRTPFSNPALKQFLDERGTTLVVPKQFLDSWTVSPAGVAEAPNDAVKTELGF